MLLIRMLFCLQLNRLLMCWMEMINALVLPLARSLTHSLTHSPIHSGAALDVVNELLFIPEARMIIESKMENFRQIIDLLLTKMLDLLNENTFVREDRELGGIGTRSPTSCSLKYHLTLTTSLT